MQHALFNARIKNEFYKGKRGIVLDRLVIEEFSGPNRMGS
jgi:hypothetical protein